MTSPKMALKGGEVVCAADRDLAIARSAGGPNQLTTECREDSMGSPSANIEYFKGSFAGALVAPLVFRVFSLQKKPKRKNQPDIGWLLYKWPDDLLLSSLFGL